MAVSWAPWEYTEHILRELLLYSEGAEKHMLIIPVNLISVLENQKSNHSLDVESSLFPMTEGAVGGVFLSSHDPER